MASARGVARLSAVSASTSPPPDDPLPGESLEAVRWAVTARHPCDARERRSRARILAEFDRLPRPFDRRADPVHVTASGIVVSVRGTLLHRHKVMGAWMQPGGHLDPGEAPWEAAAREVDEETGIAARHPAGGARLVHVDVHDAPRGHIHLDLRYLLYADPIEPAPPAGESPTVRWFSWDDALAVADAGLAGALRALRPG